MFAASDVADNALFYIWFLHIGHAQFLYVSSFGDKWWHRLHTLHVNKILFGVETSTHCKIFERLFAAQHATVYSVAIVYLCIFDVANANTELEIVIKYAKHSTPLKFINSTMKWKNEIFR